MRDTRLCLSDTDPGTSIEQVIRAAAETGFSCLDVWAPALETYLATYPLVVLDALLGERRLHIAAISGLDPLPIGSRERLLLAQARFLDLCVHLDTLGGGILVVELEQYAGDERTERTVTTLTAHALQSLSDLAAPFEVRIALAAGHADRQSTVRSLAHSCEIIEHTARHNVGLALDVQGCAQTTDALSEVEALDLDKVWLAHLDTEKRADKSSAPRAVCAHLRDRGFRGPYSVRPPPGTASPVERARMAREVAMALVLPS